MSASGGDRRAARQHLAAAVGQPALRLARPGELHRRRADDDAPGTRRRPRAWRAPRPSCRAPARRRESSAGPRARSGRPAHWNGASSPPSTAATSGERRPRLVRREAAIARRAARCSAASAASSPRPPAGRADAVAGDEGIELVGDPRVGLQLPPRVPGQPLERLAGVVVPQHLEREHLAGDAADEDQPAPAAAPRRARRARGSARRRRSAGPGPSSASASAARRVHRHERPPRVELGAIGRSAGGNRAGERVERPPAAAVVGGGAHVAHPALGGGREPGVELRRGAEVRVGVQQPPERHRHPVVGRGRPLARAPVEAAARAACGPRRRVRAS